MYLCGLDTTSRRSAEDTTLVTPPSTLRVCPLENETPTRAILYPRQNATFRIYNFIFCERGITAAVVLNVCDPATWHGRSAVGVVRGQSKVSDELYTRKSSLERISASLGRC
jgi:hypothetical protein